jgi:hypothetical protein
MSMENTLMTIVVWFFDRVSFDIVNWRFGEWDGKDAL